MGNRLDPVDQDAADPPREMRKEERDSRIEPAGQRPLPVAPVIEVEVAPRHPFPPPGERAEIVTDGKAGSEKFVGVKAPLGVFGDRGPSEEAFGVVGVVLGIPPCGHIEDDTPFLFGSVGEKLKPELGLSDSGRTDQNGHCSGEKSSADFFIESGYSS